MSPEREPGAGSAEREPEAGAAGREPESSSTGRKPGAGAAGREPEAGSGGSGDESPPLSAPRRLHPAGVVVDALASLRQLAIPAVVAIAVSLRGDEGGLGELGRAGAWAVALGLFALVSGFLSWQTTEYRLVDSALKLRRGFLHVRETSLPLERVQSVDTVRGPVQRLLGVEELHVQAAGGGGEAEIILRALSSPAAAELRGALARGLSSGAAPALPTRRLGAWALVAAAATSGQLGVILPVVAGIGQVADELIEGRPEQLLGFVPGSAAGVVLSLAALLAAAWLLAALGTVVAFAGFTVARDPARLHIRRGLLQRRESTLPVARVHAVRVVEGLLRQPFGLAQVRVESAGYAAEAANAQTLFPLMRRTEVPGLLRELLPELADGLGDLTGAPVRARRRYVAPPVIALVVLAAGLAVVTPWGALAALGAVPAGLWGWGRYRAVGWRLEPDRVVVRFRRLARTTAVVARDRLQERRVSQTALQRRADLADLDVAVASGARFGVAQVEAASAMGLLAALGPGRAAAG